MPPVFAGWRNIFLRRPPGKYNTRSTPLASVQHQQTPPRAAPHPNPHPIPPNQPVRNHTPFYKQYNFWTTALAVFAILAALAFFLLQWLYQDWTAHKDFREYCQSEQVGSRAIQEVTLANYGIDRTRIKLRQLHAIKHSQSLCHLPHFHAYKLRSIRFEVLGL